MLKNLVTVANRLDSLGLSKEADFIDQMITKYSMYFDDGYFTCDRCGGLHHETNTVRMGSKDLCPDCVDPKKSHHKEEGEHPEGVTDLG